MTDLHVCDKCHMKPGSDTAAAQGCECPRMDNARGHTDWPVVVEGCPLHWGQP